MQVSNSIDLGVAIKNQRTKLGITQGDLASKSGISRTIINQVEKGKPYAQLATIFKILTALNLELTIEQSKHKTAGEDFDLDTP